MEQIVDLLAGHCIDDLVLVEHHAIIILFVGARLINRLQSMVWYGGVRNTLERLRESSRLPMLMIKL